jgi:hypothetical protein
MLGATRCNSSSEIAMGARMLGAGEASRRGKWLPPFGGVVRWEAEMGDKKKEGVTWNHWFPYRKEERDSLPGSSEETPQAGGYRSGGFYTEIEPGFHIELEAPVRINVLPD